MKTKLPPEITAITQATGWVAVFGHEDGSESKCPVVVWAIVRDDNGDTRVVGMSQSNETFLDEDDNNSNFLRWDPA